MEKYALDQNGFITKYLITPVTEKDVETNLFSKNQLEFERMLRDEFTATTSRELVKRDDFQYFYDNGSSFVDKGEFYHFLRDVSFDAKTILVVNRDITVNCTIYSYCNVQMYVNDVHVGAIDKIMYKPISSTIFSIDLKKGENELYFRLRTLGVRDTRVLFATQFDNIDEIEVTLESGFEKEESIDSYLSALNLSGNILEMPFPLNGASLNYSLQNPDFKLRPTLKRSIDLSGKTTAELPSEVTSFSVSVEGSKLSRNLEVLEHIVPKDSENISKEENYKRIFTDIANVFAVPRGANEYYAIYPILARYFLGINNDVDINSLFNNLDLIQSRRDCADFLTCGFVRFFSLYDLPEELEKRNKEVFLDFRYWMDEEGSDAMCFWSENHSLMFFVTAYLAGNRYPDDIFHRSGKTGAQLKEQARIRIKDWVEDAAQNGFDEFYSAGYTPITFAAILNVVDFCDEELSNLATKAIDRMLTGLAKHTFDGVSIAPQGRVYRELIYPFNQTIQSLVNLIDPSAPRKFSEWLAAFATTKYKIPDNLEELINASISETYKESNCYISLEKSRGFMLTSIQSPSTFRAWETNEKDDGTVLSVKTLNEKFHGTTQIQPGVFGYQQHLWYAALSNSAISFVNHPGVVNEKGSVRPGYWYGNGVMPAIMQDKNVLYTIYNIPESHPVKFTHLYLPKERFDNVFYDGNWVFAKKDKSYMAIWCSSPLVEHNDMLFDCELRCYSDTAAYLCICSDSHKNIEDFILYAKSSVVEFEDNTLKAFDKELTFETYTNNSQYI